MEAKDSVDVLVRRRLRELRIQRGLTLEDVAQAARIDVSTLSRYLQCIPAFFINCNRIYIFAFKQCSHYIYMPKRTC